MRKYPFILVSVFALAASSSSFAMAKSAPVPPPPLQASSLPTPLTPADGNLTPIPAPPSVVVAPPAPALPTDPVPPPRLAPPLPAVETTLQGAVFTQVYSYPTMTEAYRDQNGLLWAASIDEGRQPYAVAEQFCESYGLRLPTEAEVDTLRAEMGYGTPAGYTEQAILADLQADINGCNDSLRSFWTSTYTDDCHVQIFRPSTGYVFSDSTRDENGVICVK